MKVRLLLSAEGHSISESIYFNNIIENRWKEYGGGVLLMVREIKRGLNVFCFMFNECEPKNWMVHTKDLIIDSVKFSNRTEFAWNTAHSGRATFSGLNLEGNLQTRIWLSSLESNFITLTKCGWPIQTFENKCESIAMRSKSCIPSGAMIVGCRNTDQSTVTQKLYPSDWPFMSGNW